MNGYSSVMPDAIGHLVLSAGKRLPVGAGNDGEGPAMTVFVMPDLIGHLAPSTGKSAGEIW